MTIGPPPGLATGRPMIVGWHGEERPATMGRTMPIDISLETARRYVLGRQGLWPGRRWQGLAGTEQAMRAVEHLQLDPLVIIARAHDLILQSRVIGYRPDDWATLTYDQRKFFDWGGWLAVRPMDELPYWRVLMRRELDQPNWIEFRAEHAAAIAEMRDVLRERGDGQQPRLRDGRPDPGRPLPRPEGQRARAALPVADRRRDGVATRAVRAGVRPDRVGRARRRSCASTIPPRPTTTCC